MSKIDQQIRVICREEIAKWLNTTQIPSSKDPDYPSQPDWDDAAQPAAAKRQRRAQLSEIVDLANCLQRHSAHADYIPNTAIKILDAMRNDLAELEEIAAASQACIDALKPFAKGDPWSIDDCLDAARALATMAELGIKPTTGESK